MCLKKRSDVFRKYKGALTGMDGCLRNEGSKASEYLKFFRENFFRLICTKTRSLNQIYNPLKILPVIKVIEPATALHYKEQVNANQVDEFNKKNPGSVTRNFTIKMFRVLKTY